MRPLTSDEQVQVFQKLAKFIGSNVKLLIDRPDAHVFRLHNNRVYYVSEAIMLKTTNVSRQNLLSLGTCIGKFTHSMQFRLLVTALPILAQFAKNKLWIKPGGEMSFLYGNHVLKAHLGRISEDVAQNQGIIVYNMSDVPLGFGVAAKSAADTRKMEPTAIVAFHQADVGEYLRDEETLT